MNGVRANRASRKNPKVFGDEYVTTMNGRRRTTAENDLEESSIPDFKPVERKKPGRKRERKTEVSL